MLSLDRSTSRFAKGEASADCFWITPCFGFTPSHRKHGHTKGSLSTLEPKLHLLGMALQMIFKISQRQIVVEEIRHNSNCFPFFGWSDEGRCALSTGFLVLEGTGWPGILLSFSSIGVLQLYFLQPMVTSQLLSVYNCQSTDEGPSA